MKNLSRLIMILLERNLLYKFSFLFKCPYAKITRKKTYSGKENTPLGKGYSASGEKVGKRMKGRDGKMYVVNEYKNGKRWARVVSTSSKRHTSPRIKFADLKTNYAAAHPEPWRIPENDIDDVFKSVKEKYGGDHDVGKLFIDILQKDYEDEHDRLRDWKFAKIVSCHQQYSIQSNMSGNH